VLFDGGINLKVTGGGVWSNACIDAGGNVAVDVDVTGGVTCTGSGCYTSHGVAGQVTPLPQDVGFQLPSSTIIVPTLEGDCNSLPSYGVYNGDGTLEPGRYSRITISNGDHQLQPGLFCLSGNGDVFKNTGGTIQGENVTFYVQQGGFNAQGNGVVKLTAPPAVGCAEPCTTYKAKPGVLIYLAPGNTSTIALLGSAENNFQGLVYAPDGTIDVGGTANETSKITAQLIGFTVRLHGNAEVLINFQDKTNFEMPAALELSK
jgi:hypothetical protein